MWKCSWFKQFPGQLEDCEKVLEYVIAIGPAEYGIDPRKVFITTEPWVIFQFSDYRYGRLCWRKSCSCNSTTETIKRRISQDSRTGDHSSHRNEIWEVIVEYSQALFYPILQFSDLQTYSYRYWKREMDGLVFLGKRYNKHMFFKKKMKSVSALKENWIKNRIVKGCLLFFRSAYSCLLLSLVRGCRCECSSRICVCCHWQWTCERRI